MKIATILHLNLLISAEPTHMALLYSVQQSTKILNEESLLEVNIYKTFAEYHHKN